MKKQIILSVSILLLLIGCKKADVDVSGEPVTIEPKVIGTEECYSYQKDGNKIELMLARNGSEASGSLINTWSEKDSNSGTFKGKIENNILLADYTFQSEGTESTRQVAFQFKHNQWIEGFGEMNEDGTKFKDVSQIKFTSAMSLSKTNCPK